MFASRNLGSNLNSLCKLMFLFYKHQNILIDLLKVKSSKWRFHSLFVSRTQVFKFISAMRVLLWNQSVGKLIICDKSFGLFSTRIFQMWTVGHLFYNPFLLWSLSIFEVTILFLMNLICFCVLKLNDQTWSVWSLTILRFYFLV